MSAYMCDLSLTCLDASCRKPEAKRQGLADRAAQQRLVDRTTFLWIQDLLIGKRVTADTREANRLWRGRYSQRWDDADPHETLLDALGAPRKHSFSGDRAAPFDRDVLQQRAEALQELAKAFADSKAAKNAEAAGGSKAVTLDDQLLARVEAAQRRRRRVDAIVKSFVDALPPRQDRATGRASARHPVVLETTESKVESSLKILKKTGTFSIPAAPLAARDASPGGVSRAGPAHAILAAMKSRDEPPTAGQCAILEVVCDYIDDVAAGRSPRPFRIFMHGAGGTGKSYVLRCIDELFGSIGCHVVPCALTGVACAAISCRDPARTLHNTCNLHVETLRPCANIRPADEAYMKARFEQCGMLAVDEVSFTSARALTGISECMTLLRPEAPSEDAFRGMPVMICGDMHQLPGMGGTLYEDYFRHSSNHDSTRGVGQAALKGSALLKSFRMMHLTDQMRTKDAEHLARLNALRTGNTIGIKQYLLNHVLTANDLRTEPAWGRTLIIVSENEERVALNAVQSEQFAIDTNQLRVTWRLPFAVAPPKKRNARGGKGSATETLHRNAKGAVVKLDAVRAASSASFVNEVYEHTQALTYRFVAGAPAMLLSNLNPSRGAANGVACEMHSLTFKDEHREEARRLFASATGTVALPSGIVPTHVNVRLRGPHHDKVFVQKVELTSEEAREREAWIASWARVTLVDGDVVIPVPTQEARKPITAHAGGGATLRVKFTGPAVDLAFAATIHKAQAATFDRVIISAVGLTYHALYVAMSRVRDGKNLRILRPKYAGSLDYIDTLTPPPM